MLFADEVVDADGIDEVPSGDDVKTSSRELDIAKQLVESLAGHFDPDKYHDTYREEILALIERKAAGEEIAVQPPSEDVSAPVPDLMSALKASLDAVRERDGAANGADGAKKAPARKAPAKKPAAKRAPAAKKSRASTKK
jgi:DNA end-binding protein Ku